MTVDDVLEPFSPRALHLLGHHPTWVGAYFQAVLLLGRVATHPDAAVGAWRKKRFEAAKADGATVAGLVRLAHQLGLAHGLDLPPAPATPDAWDPWRTAVFRELRARADLRDPACAAFPWGWEHGLARATLAGMIDLGELHLAGVDETAALEAGLADLRGIATRWPASARLIETSRELQAGWTMLHGELERLSKARVGHGADVDALISGARRLGRALGELEGVAWRGLSPDRPAANRPPR